MSQVDDVISAHNLRMKQGNYNAALEHMAEQEDKRISNEIAMQFSVKGNWERLKAKRSTEKVLQRLPLQLQ